MKDLTKTIIFTGKAGIIAYKWLSAHKNKSKYIIKLLLEDMIIGLEDGVSLEDWNALKRTEIDSYFDALRERLKQETDIDDFIE